MAKKNFLPFILTENSGNIALRFSSFIAFNFGSLISCSSAVAGPMYPFIHFLYDLNCGFIADISEFTEYNSRSIES